MLTSILQVVFAAIRTVLRSAVNIMLYSLLSRIFHTWLGFNSLISFVCSAYCLSKIVGYFKHAWVKARLNNKKPDEKIVFDTLVWQSPTTMSLNSENPNESMDKFEIEWQYLLDDDAKNIFPSIVNIPFSNVWLFFSTIMIIDYQMNNSDYSYTTSLIRTISFLVILICGSSVRYQTLLERERKNCFNLLTKQREETERYILYSNNTVPVGSVCLHIKDTSESSVFIVQFYQSNSKFDDYLHLIVHFICQKLIQRIQTYGNETKKSARLVWYLPTCKQNWTPALQANKFVLRNTFKDFSFLPLVNSYVEQYDYFYEYKNLPSENVADASKNE